MNTEIGTLILVFLTEAQPYSSLQDTIDDKPTGQGNDDAQSRPCQLRQETYTAPATERLQSEDAGRNSAPGPA